MATSNFIKTQLRNALIQGSKTYSVYDLNGRLVEFYEAPAYAENNDPAILTTYEYVVGSSNVLKSRESTSTWNSTWDI
jgi:hypothetical protein